MFENGGELLEQSMTTLHGQIDSLSTCVKLSPITNQATLDTAHVCLEKKPDANHFLLCETAYFSRMHDINQAFALPLSYFKKGIHRYGGDGLCHEWACRQTAPHLSSSSKRIVSIHLCDHPTLAAVQDGIAVDSSIGFSKADGLPSLNSCGSIDPAIVLLMAENGMPAAQIKTFLCQQSGLATILPVESQHLIDIYDDIQPTTLLAREILFYKIIEYIGSEMVTLGGLDALVFTTESLHQTRGFINKICHHLAFLGIQLLQQPLTAGQGFRLTDPTQPRQVFVYSAERWRILGEWLKSASY